MAAAVVVMMVWCAFDDPCLRGLAVVRHCAAGVGRVFVQV
jgi:hypothetical protein